MPPCKLVPLVVAAGLLSLAGASAQVANSDFKIDKIVPALQQSPEGAGSYNKRVRQAKSWLEVETSFDWTPRTKDVKYLDDLTFTYYILLNNAQVTEDRKPTMLVGTVTHTSVMPGKDLKSVMYVAPRTLERLFDGGSPNNPAQAVFDVGVTISNQGQVVASSSLKGRGDWWTQYQPVQGYVLNKSESPFSHLAWDYYEPIKAKTSGN